MREYLPGVHTARVTNRDGHPVTIEFTLEINRAALNTAALKAAASRGKKTTAGPLTLHILTVTET